MVELDFNLFRRGLFDNFRRKIYKEIYEYLDSNHSVTFTRRFFKTNEIKDDEIWIKDDGIFE